MDSELENEITVTIFRLLVLDLLNLFEALNQGMINILGTLKPRLLTSPSPACPSVLRRRRRQY